MYSNSVLEAWTGNKVEGGTGGSTLICILQPSSYRLMRQKSSTPIHFLSVITQINILSKLRVYILEQLALNYSLAFVHSNPSWLVWAEIKHMHTT